MEPSTWAEEGPKKTTRVVPVTSMNYQQRDQGSAGENDIDKADPTPKAEGLAYL